MKGILMDFTKMNNIPDPMICISAYQGCEGAKDAERFDKHCSKYVCGWMGCGYKTEKARAEVAV